MINNIDIKFAVDETVNDLDYFLKCLFKTVITTDKYYFEPCLSSIKLNTNLERIDLHTFALGLNITEELTNKEFGDNLAYVKEYFIREFCKLRAKGDVLIKRRDITSTVTDDFENNRIVVKFMCRLNSLGDFKELNNV